MATWSARGTWWKNGGDVGRMRLSDQGAVALIGRPSDEALRHFEQAVGVIHRRDRSSRPSCTHPAPVDLLPRSAIRGPRPLPARKPAWRRHPDSESSDSADGEGLIEREHADPRLTQEAELSALGVPLDQAAHGLLAEPAGSGHAAQLVDRRGRADVRIEAAPADAVTGSTGTGAVFSRSAARAGPPRAASPRRPARVGRAEIGAGRGRVVGYGEVAGGRPQKYRGSSKGCPMSEDPTTFLSLMIRLPFARQGQSGTARHRSRSADRRAR